MTTAERVDAYLAQRGIHVGGAFEFRRSDDRAPETDILGWAKLTARQRRRIVKKWWRDEVKPKRWRRARRRFRPREATY